MTFSTKEQLEAEDGVYALFCLSCKRAFGIDTDRVTSDVSLPPSVAIEIQRRKRGATSGRLYAATRYRSGRDLRNETSPFRSADSRLDGSFKTANTPPALFAHFQWGPSCTTQTLSCNARTVQLSELSEDSAGNILQQQSLKLTVKKEPITEYAWTLFEDTSRTSLIDLPLCAKCWKEWLQNEQKAVDALAEEVSVLESLTDLVPESLSLCLCDGGGSSRFVDGEATKTVEECFELDRELQTLRSQLCDLSAEDQAHEIEEDDTLRCLHSAQFHNAFLLDGEAAVVMSTEQLSNRQKKLENVLLLSEFFIINTSGTFGAINRLRLGRITNPSDTAVEFPVTVTEVNCACGYLLHLLSYMCHINKVVFASTVLRPNGDCSTIELVHGGGKKNEVLDFFITEKFFKWKTFGGACAAFLHCTKELVSALQTKVLAALPAHKDSHGSVSFPPHPIDGDKVGGCSLKSGDTNDENWVKGMKCLLAVLDWCIATTTTVSP